MTNVIQYKGLLTGVGPTPIIWSEVDILNMLKNPEVGFYLNEEFNGFDGLLASTRGQYTGGAGAYRSYQDTGDVVSQLATDVTGVLDMTTAATDNNESWMQLGGLGTHAVISTTAGADTKLYFEARIKIPVLANNMFVGLAESASAIADFVTDAGAMISRSFIGFRILEGFNSTIDFVFRKNGQAEQTAIAACKTLVAGTYVKLGFLWDPTFPNVSKRIRVFVDGVEAATGVTSTQIAAATFPNGDRMAFQIGHKNQAATARTLNCDWWRFAQIRP